LPKIIPIQTRAIQYAAGLHAILYETIYKNPKSKRMSSEDFILAFKNFVKELINESKELEIGLDVSDEATSTTLVDLCQYHFLLTAFLSGQINLIEHLKASFGKNFNPNAQSALGETALHAWLRRRGKIGLLTTEKAPLTQQRRYQKRKERYNNLLENYLSITKCNPDVKDLRNKTPFDLAKNISPSFVSVFEKYTSHLSSQTNPDTHSLHNEELIY